MADKLKSVCLSADDILMCQAVNIVNIISDGNEAKKWVMYDARWFFDIAIRWKLFYKRLLECL